MTDLMGKARKKLKVIVGSKDDTEEIGYDSTKRYAYTNRSMLTKLSLQSSQ